MSNAPVYRYGAAAAILAATVGIREAFGPILGPHAPNAPFALALLLIGRYWGRGPALMAAALGTLGVGWFLIEPRYSLLGKSPSDLVTLAFLAVLAILIALLSGSAHESLRAAAGAEAALRRETEMIQLSHDAVITADANRVITSWNAGAAEMYGWTEAEAVGKVIHTLLQTRNHVSTAEIDRVLLREGRWDGELIHTTRDGREVVTDSRHVLIRGSGGAATGILEINRDITGKKYAEEQLRGSEAQFRTLANAIPQLCWMANGNGWIFWYNERWYQYTGTTPQQMEGWGWQSVHDPDVLPGVMERWKASLETGQPFEMTFPLRGADGAYRPFLTRVVPIRDADGKVARWFGTNTDISEQQRIEQALRQSERRVREKLESILSPEEDIGDLELRDILDADAIQSLLSDFSELTDIQVGVLDTRGNRLAAAGLQEICTEFHRVHPETRNNCLESDTQLTEGIAQGQHKLYKCKNNLCDVATPLVVGGRHVGNIFTGQFLLEDEPVSEEAFASQAARYGFDREPYLAMLRTVPRLSRKRVGTAIDFLRKFGEMVGKLSLANIKLAKSLNQLKRTQEALQESYEQRGLALEAANLGAWDYRIDTGELVLDERCRNMFGLSTGSRIGYSEVIARVHPEDRAGTHEAVKQAIAGANGGAYDREFRVIWADGSEHWVASHGRVFFDDGTESRRATRFAGVNMDVTQRRAAEESLRQKQKLESIGLLAGGVAHDFNNLLTIIIGSASSALEDYPEIEYTQSILTAAERAAHLTRQLLAYSGRGSFVTKAINLNEAVSRSTELLSAALPKRVRLSFSLATELPPVEADPSRIDQILMNLVVNAGEAIPPRTDGRVDVATSVCKVTAEMARRHSHGYDVAPGLHVCLAVTDNGIGMDEATLGRVFDPFFSTKFTGRGLGLAAVHGIVRAARGFIEIRSTPGEGTTFRVFLPASEKKLPARSARNIPKRPAPKNATVLVVDDEEMVRQLASMTLRRHGYDVQEARDGKEALQVLDRSSIPPSVVLLDLAMPGMGGDELVAILASRYPGVKILLSSGYPEEEARKTPLTAGASGFLQKPYTGIALAEKIAAVIGEDRRFVEGSAGGRQPG